MACNSYPFYCTSRYLGNQTWKMKFHVPIGAIRTYNTHTKYSLLHRYTYLLAYEYYLGTFSVTKYWIALLHLYPDPNLRQFQTVIYRLLEKPTFMPVDLMLSFDWSPDSDNVQSIFMIWKLISCTSLGNVYVIMLCSTK